MSLLSKSNLTALFMFIGALCNQSYALDATNFIRNGKAKIQLDIEDGGNIPDSLEASVITLSLFDRPFESTTTKMNRAGNKFELSVPLYTNEAIVGIIVESQERRLALGLIELNQDNPLIMKGCFDSEGALDVSKSNSSGFNQYELNPTPENKSIVVEEIIYRFISYRLGFDEREPSVRSDDYKDWKTIGLKLDSLYQIQLEYALNGKTIPEAVNGWLINNLKYFYAANWRFNYVERAKRTFNIKDEVVAPPLEYYSFLNEIDFALILNHSDVFGPYYLFDKMLLQLPIGVKPIDDTPVDVWKKEVKDRLAPIMPNPAPILIDLLAATSYVQQIKENNRPLSDAQIVNITNGFDAEMSAVILDMNQALISELESDAIIADYCGQHFSLDTFLSEHPDTPVIVDLWNTWCTPCLNALKEIKSFMKTHNHSDGILRLYICDESSPLNEWKRLAPRIGGTNIRISSKDMESLLAKFELTAFPSYLFFNGKHELVKKQTGFSDINQYNNAVHLLSGD